MKLAGVDGCRKGWIVALADEWPCQSQVHLEFHRDFKAILAATKECRAVAVDMPIGLPDNVEPRACDLAARQALGPRRSSIFLAPPRSCLDARTPREFQTLHREIRGVGAGLPVWGIVPKMLEVNLAFEQDLSLQQRVFEFHPELAWLRLSNGRHLGSKKSVAGILERIGLLNAVAPRWAPQMIANAGSPAIDDVLDAIIGLSSAHTFRDTDAPVNDRGIRMRIH